MKLLVYILIGLASFELSAQIVNIPDANFKAALIAHINPVIDTNGDGEIQVSEAQIVTQLEVSGKEITNLTGIEAFTSLEILNCRNNFIEDLSLSNNLQLQELDAQLNALGTVNISENVALTAINVSENLLTVLDLSQNSSLKILRCNSNFLTSLNVTSTSNMEQIFANFNELESLTLGNQPNLTTISARTNLLTSLDVSQCPILGTVSIQFNEISSIDTSANPMLRIFRCHGNELVSLDLASNSNLQSFFCYLNPLQELNLKNGANSNLFVVEANLNPDLSCIQVDDAAMANNGEGVYADWLVDKGVFYAEDCSLGADDFDLAEIFITPNPVAENFRITSEKTIQKLEIYNLQGQKMQTTNWTSSNPSVDISYLSSGIYFILLHFENGPEIIRVIKN